MQCIFKNPNRLAVPDVHDQASCADFTALKPHYPYCLQDQGQTLSFSCTNLVPTPLFSTEVWTFIILIPYAKRVQAQSQMDVACNPSPALTSHSGSSPPEKTASVEESTY